MAIKYGTNGNDKPLTGTSGNDTIYGLDGNDRILTDDGDDIVDAGDGDDEINGYEGLGSAYTFYPATGIKKIHGGNGNDFIVGGSSNDELFGDAGFDTLYGRNGNDILDGGDGADYMNGGSGNDTYYVSDAYDLLDDASGNDTAYVSASFVKIPSFIEKVIYTHGAKALPYWVDALLPDDAAGNYFDTLLGSSNTFYYNFPTSLPSYDTNASHGYGFKTFSSVQIARTETALNYIASVIDVHFKKATTANGLNTFVFANNNQSSSAGSANYPSNSMIGSDIYFDTSAINSKFSDGSYAALTLIHEIGHALGLEHPFSYAQAGGGGASDPPYLTGTEDSTAWTVMSYEDTPAQYYLSFSPLDIAALQYIYGPSQTGRAGNDIYKVSSSAPNFIWDGAGTDTIDLSNVNQGATVYLTPGYWGFVGSQQASTITTAGQITVNFGSIIENLTGTSFADKLYGSDADNTIEGGLGHDWLEGLDGNDVLVGGLGDDQLNGGMGIDTAKFTGVYADYSSSSSKSTFTLIDKRSNVDGMDVLTNVERLKFSDKSVAIDLDGHAGIAVKVIGAVLGKDAVKNPGLVGIGLSYLDLDLSYSDLGLLALNAVGATSSDAIVSRLWFNLVGSTASSLEKAPYIKMLADGMKPGDLVVMAADLPLNASNIDLVGLIQTGVEFVLG
jgi:Ca2+-binding RTX toxin-like protein